MKNKKFTSAVLMFFLCSVCFITSCSNKTSTINNDKEIFKEKFETIECADEFFMDNTEYLVEDLQSLNIRDIKEVNVVESGYWGVFLLITDNKARTFFLLVDDYGYLVRVIKDGAQGETIYIRHTDIHSPLKF